jgi:hypothetical protein
MLPLLLMRIQLMFGAELPSMTVLWFSLVWTSVIKGEDFAIAYGGTDAGFHEYTLSAAATYSITQALGVTASVTYVDSVDEDVMPDQDLEWLGGVRISYRF